MKIFRFVLIFIILIELILILFFVFKIVRDKYFVDDSYQCIDCNVLLITMDSLRADHMGIYGYERNTTPNIDKLAEQGIVFENFIANGAVTFISLPSMFSGKYPEVKELKVITYNTGEKLFYYFIPKESDTFTKIFSSRGYRTSLVNANNISYTNVFKDFQEKTIFSMKVDDLSVADNVMTAITKSKKDKFFLWAHFLSPHVPYLPPYPYNNSFYQDEYYNKLNVIDKSLIEGLPYLNTQEFDFYVSQYDGEILYVDNQIQRIINFLEKEELLDNTLVIISADHGESFGENNNIYFGHGSLYDTNIKIPLIIYNPKTNIHKRIYNQIQGIDLFPTLFNIVGIRNFFKSDGHSFYGIITENKTSENNIAFSLASNTTFSLRTNNWKYIHHYSGEAGELYNLKEDPQEILNLINSSNKLKDQMEPELVEKIEELRSK